MKKQTSLYWILFILISSSLTFAQEDTRRAKYKSISVESGKHIDKDLEVIRTRVLEDLLKPSVNNQHISRLISSFKKDRTWPNINYEDVSRTGFRMIVHLNNVYDMALAYKKTGSDYYDDPQLKKVISDALDYWLEKDYISDNWWWNEMGTPNIMGRILLVLDEQLTSNQREKGIYIAGRANLKASGARPGGDLIQIASMRGNQALLQRNSEEFKYLVDTMVSEIKITPDDRGLKPDMSFHHRVDKVISTLTYGIGFANSFAEWAVKVRGTKYAFPDSSSKLLIDYFLDGIAGSMVHGTYPDPGAKNRELSRQGALNRASTSLPTNLMLVSNHRKDELAEIVRLRKGGKNPRLAHSRFYRYSEYYSHQRPKYFASVRMHSARNNTMEEPHNEEGLKNHHFGDGSLFVSRTGKEYYDIFPVWDWQKIPGTTVMQKPELPHWKEIAKKGKNTFTGAITDGKYGVAAMNFISTHDSLKARKSWFFFDSEIICLGAGITAKGNLPVVTTANQSLLHGTVTIKDHKGIRKLKNNEEVQSEISWINHDTISYLFPGKQMVKVNNKTHKGSWRSITNQARETDKRIQNEVFTVTLNHGTNPSNSYYTYIILPSITAEETKRYDPDKNFSVLQNSENLQAVYHLNTQLVQAVFYEAGSLQLSPDQIIKVNQPCLISAKLEKGIVKQLTFADPTQSLDRVEYEISGQNYSNKRQASDVNKVDLPQGIQSGSSTTVNIP